MKSCASEIYSPAAVGERLREQRISLGLNQEAFAQLGGVNRNTQGSYEKGERNPDSAYLMAVAAEGVDVMYVLCGTRRSLSEEFTTPDEDELVAQFRALPESDKKTIQRIVGAMFELSSIASK